MGGDVGIKLWKATTRSRFELKNQETILERMYPP